MGGGGAKSFFVKPNLGHVRLSCGWVWVLTISKCGNVATGINSSYSVSFNHK